MHLGRHQQTLIAKLGRHLEISALPSSFFMHRQAADVCSNLMHDLFCLSFTLMCTSKFKQQTPVIGPPCFPASVYAPQTHCMLPHTLNAPRAPCQCTFSTFHCPIASTCCGENTWKYLIWHPEK